MPSPYKLQVPASDPQLYQWLKRFQECFVEDLWVPATTNVTGVSSVKGAYQQTGRIVHVVAAFTSDGNLAFPTNATIKLPIPPFYRSAYTFAAHEFKLSKKGASTTVACWMSDTTGLVSPATAITATADHYVFSGWYYTE